jgi:hypothetical protein
MPRGRRAYQCQHGTTTPPPGWERRRRYGIRSDERGNHLERFVIRPCCQPRNVTTRRFERLSCRVHRCGPFDGRASSVRGRAGPVSFCVGRGSTGASTPPLPGRTLCRRNPRTAEPERWLFRPAFTSRQCWSEHPPFSASATTQHRVPRDLRGHGRRRSRARPPPGRESSPRARPSHPTPRTRWPSRSRCGHAEWEHRAGC